jgi:hypothetical protein
MPHTARPVWALPRTFLAALIAGCLLVAGLSATASAAPRNRAIAQAAALRAASTPSPQLLGAASHAAQADRQLVANAQGLKRCLAANAAQPAACAPARALVQSAGTALATAQRRLVSLAGSSSRARAAAARVAPVVTISAEKLKWTKVHGMHTYIVLSKTPGLADREELRSGTSFTPPAVPGATVTYSVRTSASLSSWSKPKTITYPTVTAPVTGKTAGNPPAPTGSPSGSHTTHEAPANSSQSAPLLTVSGQTLSWNAIGGVSAYVLARKVAGSADQYTVVNGTSVTPAAVPGATAHYSVRTAVDGSAWSPEVSITYAATATTHKPAPAPTELKGPTSKESAVSVSSMWVGLDAGGWGSSSASDIAGAVSTVRLDTPGNISPWTAAGLRVIDDMSGPYNSGGVSALNANEWAEKAVAWYRANPQAAAIEILNEPGNQYIGWGANAGSAANAAAYDNLLKVVHEKFVANFGSSYPPLLASYDGGEGPTTWGEEMWAADPNVGSYINGITMHSYGGTSSRTASALGSRYHIEEAHNQHPGIPIYITEIGWPTAVGQAPTGDSLQWSEAEQAANITSFVNWAKSTGYIADVTIFNYRDYGSNDWYGIESASGAHKQSYSALAALRS